ncbi:hypothetical protein EDC01DRAFT_728790 [Geopyxis carbonaria]|nr:hypothetical protein EDC01DRAFT_728790 [Geopyxis carbonaria]
MAVATPPPSPHPSTLTIPTKPTPPTIPTTPTPTTPGPTMSGTTNTSTSNPITTTPTTKNNSTTTPLTTPHHLLLLTTYTLYTSLLLSLPPSSLRGPFTSPKRPLILHEALAPLPLLTAALSLPLPRRLSAALFLPPLAACYWHLLGAGAHSAAAGYAVGTYVSFMAYRTLELLVFRDVRSPPFLRLSGCDDAALKHGGDHGEGWRDTAGLARVAWVYELLNNLRGPGWAWRVPLPARPAATSTPRWLLATAARLAAIAFWLDLLCYYMRTVDTAFWLPPGHSTGLRPSAAGVPYPHLLAASRLPTPWSYPPPPLLPPLPPSGALRVAYQAALYTTRTLLAASALHGGIAGSYHAVSLLFVLPSLLPGILPRGPAQGWQQRWMAADAWPPVFGAFRAGDWGRGVRGFWGRGWHALFRSVFTAPGDALAGSGWARGGRGQVRQWACWTVALVAPFAMSAGLHAAGAWSQSFAGWGVTRFFLSQTLAIIFEGVVVTAYKRFLRPAGTGRGGTREMGRVQTVLEFVVRYAWTVGWFVATSEPFFEEYRWGGLWVTEPVPVSLVRGGGGFKGEILRLCVRFEDVLEFGMTVTPHSTLSAIPEPYHSHISHASPSYQKVCVTHMVDSAPLC